MGVSLNPEDFVEGGGLIDDVDVVITSARFELFDYNGTVIPGVPALALHMTDPEDEEFDQYYSMGKPEDWEPSEDGTTLKPIGAATNIRVTSNGGILLKSLIDAGFPVDKLGDDISSLDGMECHVIQIPAPRRSGIKEKPRADGKVYEKTILVIGEILTLPWEGKKPKASKAKAKAKAKPKAKAKSAEKAKGEPDEVGGKAVAAILEILEDAGTITKKELPAKIFQIMKTDPDRNAVVKLVFDDEFLGEGPWEYDDGTLVSA